MQVKHVPAKTKAQTKKEQMREKLKGKATLTQKEKDDLLLQMARDLGYLE